MRFIRNKKNWISLQKSTEQDVKEVTITAVSELHKIVQIIFMLKQSHTFKLRSKLCDKLTILLVVYLLTSCTNDFWSYNLDVQIFVEIHMRINDLIFKPTKWKLILPKHQNALPIKALINLFFVKWNSHIDESKNRVSLIC